MEELTSLLQKKKFHKIMRIFLKKEKEKEQNETKENLWNGVHHAKIIKSVKEV